MSSSFDKIPDSEFEVQAPDSKNWRQIVAWVGDLPPFPQVATEALSLVEDPHISTSKITEVLGHDAALAARVLKIANSSMFCFQREITTLNHAITIIGLKALKGIIVAATLRQFSRKKNIVERLVWQNSICTAVSAKLLALELRKPYGDEIYLAGLLHDLGKMVLMRYAADDYSDVFEKTKNGKSFIDAENEIFGFSHPLVGALVAKKWNFSSDTCQIILHHHDPISLEEKSLLAEKTVLVQTADLVAHKLGIGHDDGYVDVDIALKENFLHLGFKNEESIAKYFEEVSKNLSEQQSLLS